MRRLILFDIDGTLVRGGPARSAFELGLLEAFGTAGAIDSHEFSGKTDPQIARELMLGAGFDDMEIDRRLPTVFSRYLGELEARLPSLPMQAIAGVVELLGELEAEVSVGLGLLTGNVEDGARLKLASAGIETRFEVGAYGSDQEVRDHLPAVALQRALERWERGFDPQDVVIVGDTPRDVACGRGAGMRTVAVATGRFSVEALRETGADVVVDSLDHPAARNELAGR